MAGLVEWIKAFAISLGGPGLFLIAFLDSSFLSFPEVNDLLIIWLTTQHEERMVYYALMTTLGSISGCLALYTIARKGGEAFLQKRFSPQYLERAMGTSVATACSRSWSRRSCRRQCHSRSSCSRLASRECACSTSSSRLRLGAGLRYFGEGLLAVYYGDEAAEFLQQECEHRGTRRRAGGARPRRRLDPLAAPRQRLGGLTARAESLYNQSFIRIRRMPPDISVVVPDEERGTERGRALPRADLGAREPMDGPYEIVAIDDGSNDDTFARLARLQSSDFRLRVIRFRRNFGQTAAFAAGFAQARGRYIVTMDGDLAERSARHRRDGRPARENSCRHRRRLAQGSEGPVPQPPTAIDDRQLADLARDRRGASRLRVLAEGVSRRSRQVDEALRRNASVSAGDRQRVRRHHRRARRQPSRARARQVEVRNLPHHPRRAGPADGQVPHQLFDAAGSDLRAAGARHGRARHGRARRGSPT